MTKERVARVLFFLTTCISILMIILICLFLVINGIPALKEVGFLKFLTGEQWRPSNDIYGILPMIMGSIYVTAGAICIGVPIGLLTALYMAYYCPKKMYKYLRSAIDLLAGIPSVVYGFFGLIVLIPLVRNIFEGRTNGSSILTASVLLGIMILPTIISVSETSLRSVPRSYYEGALALGINHEKSIIKVMLPAAKSGVFTAIILGVGRSIGETMAVVMVAGNQARMPKGLLKGVRTLTSNIVIEMGYAAELHRDALISTALVLFVFILLINAGISLLRRRDR